MEPQLKDQTIDGVFPLTTIPAGYVFVMGDNRNDSADSRVFGPVSTKVILGKAFVVYWPIRRWRGLGRCVEQENQPVGGMVVGEPEKRRSSPLHTVLEIAVIVAAAFVIALLVQAFCLLKPFTIHQVSMRPTLEEGDRILLSRLTYHFRNPARGATSWCSTRR